MSVINGNSSELIVKNGLILNLDAGNRKSYISGSNTWIDLANSSTVVSFGNSPSFSSDGGGCFDFDGTNQYINVIRSDINGPTWAYPNVTAMTWVNINPVGNQNNIMTVEFAWEISYFGGTLNFASNPWLWRGGGNVDLNVWQLLTYRHGPTKGELFSNKKLIYSHPVDGPISTGISGEPSFTLMGRGNGTYNFMRGKMATTLLYNRALSDSEIAQNYDAMKSRFASSSLSISKVPRVPTNGLVFEIDAANTKSYVSGSTNIYDISPTNLSGSLINGVGYSSASKGSLTFDGGNDYVQVSDNPIFNFGSSNFTLSVTAKYSNNNAVIFGQTAFDGFAPLLMYRDGGSTVSFYISSNGTTWDLFSGGLNVTVTVNDWYDITLTRNGNVWTTYRNGQYVTSATVAGALYDSSENLKIGARTGLYNNYMSGSISSVRIYNRALSASEVRSMYDATKGRYGL